MELLTTRRDFERAHKLVLRYFQENGYASRRSLSNLRVMGVTYESIELAVRKLRRDGAIEELYTLPPVDGSTQRGRREQYFALTTALEARAVELPVGVVREQKALELIAEEVSC